MYFPGTDIFYSLHMNFYTQFVFLYFGCLCIFWNKHGYKLHFLWEKGLSLCILSQQLALTYKGLSESYQRPHDPERRLLQSHSTVSRCFLSARLRRISSWNNWRKDALFKQVSEGLIYITLKMLGYRGLTLSLPLQLSHLQNLSNHHWLPDIM